MGDDPDINQGFKFYLMGDRLAGQHRIVSIQGFLLVFCLGATPMVLGSYAVLEIEPGSGTCKARQVLTTCTIFTVLGIFLETKLTDFNIQ